MGWFDFLNTTENKENDSEQKKKEQNAATKDKFENTGENLNSTLSDFQKLLIDLEKQRRQIEGEPPLAPDDPLLNTGKEPEKGGVGTETQATSASTSELTPAAPAKKPDTKFYYYTDDDGNIRKTTDFMYWYEDHGQGAVNRGYKEKTTTVSSETIDDPSKIPYETDEIKNREIATDSFKIKSKKKSTGDILYETALMREREQALKRKLAPKVKREAKSSYKPKKEINKNIKVIPFDESNSYLNNATAWITDPTQKQQKFSLFLNPEDELKFKQTNKPSVSLKIEDRKFTQIEKDILQSMIDDIADVSNYLRIIDKTYSSKNNSITSVLENLKRKQKKSNSIPQELPKKPVIDFQKVFENAIDNIELYRDPATENKTTLLRQEDPEDSNKPALIQSVKVRYETGSNPKRKKIPVIDFQKVFENAIDNVVVYRGPMIPPTTDEQMLKQTKDLFEKIRKAEPNYKWKM